MRTSGKRDNGMGVWERYSYSRAALFGAEGLWCKRTFIVVFPEYRIILVYCSVSSGKGKDA